jgi:hypothetical protein
LSFIYDLAKKPVKFLADSPNLTKGLGYGAAGLSLAVLGGMAYGKGRQFMKNMNLGKTAAGIAEGKAVEAATGVTPVFVTNWPAGGAGGGIPPILPEGGAGLGLMGKLGVGAVFGLAVYEITSILEKKFIGGAIGSKAYDITHSGEAGAGKKTDALLAQAHDANMRGDYKTAKQILNQIKLIVHIDKDGRVKTDSDDINTNIDVNRGRFNPIGD